MSERVHHGVIAYEMQSDESDSMRVYVDKSGVARITAASRPDEALSTIRPLPNGYEVNRTAGGGSATISTGLIANESEALERGLKMAADRLKELACEERREEARRVKEERLEVDRHKNAVSLERAIERVGVEVWMEGDC